ncbi:MAG TPA: hypothetical protein VGJ37_02200 [Pyrinomonadaceae bacterium]|jgi:hypothetical protein
MKSIKVIKQKRAEGAVTTTTESNKPVAPGTARIVSTIKSWIAESRERKQGQRRSLPILTLVIMVTLALVALGTPARKTRHAGVTQTPDGITQTVAETSVRPLTPEERAIKVTIATVSSFLGPPTNRYRVGEQIPITITMTNTSPATVYTCISSDLYQDLPKLMRDGKVVPYMNWQSYERLNAQRDHTCENENLPEPVLLKPNEPQLADWFVLADGAISSGAEAWYDPLPPGKYELSIQRRLACCEGPMVESNKTSFEVVR